MKSYKKPANDFSTLILGKSSILCITPFRILILIQINIYIIIMEHLAPSLSRPLATRILKI